MYGLIKKKKFHAHLSWTNTPIQNSEYLKSYHDFTSSSETQPKETFDKDFKTMKN